MADKPKVTGLYDCGYYDTSFLLSVEKELQRKAFQVKSGLDAFTKAEQLAYMVLDSQGFLSVEDSTQTLEQCH
jgi:hypothetical protein